MTKGSCRSPSHLHRALVALDHYRSSVVWTMILHTPWRHILPNSFTSHSLVQWSCGRRPYVDDSRTGDRFVLLHGGIVPRGEQQKFPKVTSRYHRSMTDGPSSCVSDRVYISLANTVFCSMSSQCPLVIGGFPLPAISRLPHRIFPILIRLLQQSLRGSLAR